MCTNKKDMGFGLCVGGIGVGKCGNNKSEQSSSITNTAIAKAYYSNAFKCENTIHGGNSVTSGGFCSCGRLGIHNSRKCAEYELAKKKIEAETCSKSLQTAKETGLTPEEITCLCGSGGAGCNINIDQTSLITSQQICKNTNDVKTKLNDHFVNDMMSSIKSQMSDIGGLFDSVDQGIVSDLSNKIQQSITTKMITDVSQIVTTKNEVKADCGGINIGITQMSHFNGILSVLNQNRVIQDASNDISNHMKSVLERKDDGFLGWITSTAGIIVMIIIGLVVIVGIVLIVKYKGKGRGGSPPAY